MDKMRELFRYNDAKEPTKYISLLRCLSIQYGWLLNQYHKFSYPTQLDEKHYNTCHNHTDCDSLPPCDGFLEKKK